MYVEVDAVRLILARDSGQFERTAAGLSEELIKDAIKSAEVEINAKLGLQYKVPFEDGDVPDLIQEIAKDIAAFMADLTFRQDVDYTSDNEPMLLRYRRAEEMLQLLWDGSLTLPGATPSDTGPAPAERHYTVLNPYQGTLFDLQDFDLGPERPRYPQYPLRTEW
jgi:hypothetical protein